MVVVVVVVHVFFGCLESVISSSEMMIMVEV